MSGCPFIHPSQSDDSVTAEAHQRRPDHRLATGASVSIARSCLVMAQSASQRHGCAAHQHSDVDASVESIVPATYLSCTPFGYCCICECIDSLLQLPLVWPTCSFARGIKWSEMRRDILQIAVLVYVLGQQTASQPLRIAC